MCKSCMRRVSKVGKMSTKINLKTGATVGAGYLAANMVVNKIPFIKDQGAIVKAVTQVALGAIVTPQLVKGATGKELATGMVAAGVLNAIGSFVPGATGAAGLLRSTGSTYLPNVSGMKNAVKAPAKMAMN